MARRLTSFEAYLQAFVHDERQHVILGRILRPFCLRHWLLLAASHSPLLSSSAVKTQEDLQLAVAVFSTESNAEFFRLVNRPTWVEQRWWRRSKHHDADAVLERINFYIQDYFPAFPFWENDEEGDERVPGFFVCAAQVLPSVGREAAMNMPLGELIGWGIALHEANGKKIESLMKDADVEALREVGE